MEKKEKWTVLEKNLFNNNITAENFIVLNVDYTYSIAYPTIIIINLFVVR